MYSQWYKRTSLSIIMSLSLLLTACGNILDLGSELAALSPNVGESDDLVGVQSDLQKVLQSVQIGILGGIMQQSSLSIGSCTPQVSIGGTGVVIAFSRVGACNLDGTITVALIPPGVQVDLDVYGLKFIQKMSFDANVILQRANGGLVLGWEFLDGRISLSNSSPFLARELVLNGRVASTIGKKRLEFNSRTNVFDGATGVGLAVVAKIMRDGSATPPVRERSLQGCALSAGVPTDPNGGALGNCLSLIK